MYARIINKVLIIFILYVRSLTLTFTLVIVSLSYVIVIKSTALRITLRIVQRENYSHSQICAAAAHKRLVGQGQ